MSTAIQPQSQSSLQSDTIGFQLHIRMPGIRAKVDKTQVDFKGADVEWMHLSKDIIDSDEFRRIQGHARLMRTYVRAKSIPSPVLKGGVYLIPSSLVDLVEGRIGEMKAEYDSLVNDFIAAYQNGLVEAAQIRLGPLFDPRDYPSVPELRRSFGVETVYLSMETPTRLRSINRVIFEREQERAQARWRDLEEEVKNLMRAEMKSLVDRMCGALGTAEDGRKKQFRQGTLDKLSEFLDTAPFRNVHGDDELAKLVDSAKRLASGVDVEGVREDDHYRNAVATAFEAVKAKLDTLVVDKPKRRILFDRAEEGV